MPSVYDFRHVELDKVGRGKRRSITNTSAIASFSGVNSSSSSCSPTSSCKSGSSTPVSSGTNSLSPVSSPLMRRRGSRSEDTKNRLFGPAIESPRRIRNTLKSTIFSDAPQPAASPRGTPKRYIAVIRRNPITGEVHDNVFPKASVKQLANGLLGGSLSLPATPIRSHEAPVAGKASGIFN